MPILICPHCGAKNRVDASNATLQPVCGRCKTKLDVTTASDGHPIEVSDTTFKNLIAHSRNRPVLVDCWAPWCGPCRLIGPILDQLAATSEGRYTIAKLNVDQNPRVAGEYRIDSIPTMLLFKNGSLIDRIVGAQPKQVIAARLEAAARETSPRAGS